MTTEADRILDVLVTGNLSVLTPPERVDYFSRVCTSLGLNPLTKPFEFITLNGKLVLYATKACTDQLRDIHGVSVTITNQGQLGDLYTVTVTAQDSKGRQDSDMGVVAVGNLKGEALANAMLKAVTKAKRRVTLSICGLGMLDETEIEDIPLSAKRPPVVMPQPKAPELSETVSSPVRVPEESSISRFWKDVRAAGFKREDVVQILGHERFEELDDDQLQEILFQLKDRKQGQLV